MMEKMKYLWIFLLIFVVSCAGERTVDDSFEEVEEQEPIPEDVELPKEEPPEEIDAPVEETVEEPEPTEEQQEIIDRTKTEQVILIEKTGFSPRESRIMHGNSVVWEVNQMYAKVACYKQDGNKISSRLFTSGRIIQNETFAYEFDKPGKYLCIDPVYGSRGNVTILGDEPTASITGGVIADLTSKGSVATTIIAAIVFFALAVAFSGRRNPKSRNV